MRSGSDESLPRGSYHQGSAIAISIAACRSPTRSAHSEMIRNRHSGDTKVAYRGAPGSYSLRMRWRMKLRRHRTTTAPLS
jgi:hypothetical protein